MNSSNKKHLPNTGALVEEKALERYRVQAQQQVREFLCKDCPDQRCRTGSLCAAFLTLTDSVAWAMSAGNAEMN